MTHGIHRGIRCEAAISPSDNVNGGFEHASRHIPGEETLALDLGIVSQHRTSSK
jgi:hypothetical protein